MSVKNMRQPHGKHFSNGFPIMGCYSFLCVSHKTIVFFFFGCSVFASTSSSSESFLKSPNPPQNVSSTVTTPISSPVTDSPKLKYTLELENTSPSVLDSTIEFKAKISLITAGVAHSRFLYQWMNMADKLIANTTGGLTSKYNITFCSQNVSAGDYPMTVAVSPEKNASQMVAFKTKKFVLTKHLNTKLTLKQQLEYQRTVDVFSTYTPIQLKAHIQDTFTLVKPDYEYVWYKDELPFHASVEPEYYMDFEEPNNYTVGLYILATFEDVDGHSCLRHKRGGVFKDKGKTTYLTQDIYLKDPLEKCIITRVDSDDRSVKEGSPAIFNITCSGSSPSSVCVNVSVVNATIAANETCQPLTFVDTTNHEVQVILNETGWKDVHFYIYNDVSREHIVSSYYTYTPDQVSVTTYTLPTVFGILGILIAVTGVAYVMRLRKKPLVEVADFDFHPSLTSSTQIRNLRMSRVVNKFKYLFFNKDVQQSQQNSVNKTDTSVNRSDLADSSNHSSLYGSL